MSIRSISRRAVMCLLVLAVAGLAVGQGLTRARDIRLNPGEYSNTVVTLEGFATQWAEGRGTTNFYFLKDDWGGVIKIRTSREKPEIGKRYRVSGPVGIDVVNQNDVFISEESRVEVRGEPQAAPETSTVPPAVAAPVAAPPTAPRQSNLPLTLIVSIVVVLALLIALTAWLLLARREPPAEPVSQAAPAGAPEAPPQAVEGRTIKMFAPPPGTLKILPGRLEVVAGDDTVKEIRFYKVRGQSTPELTFGRAAGAPYTHVQLKPMTVSSRQARLTFINNQWILTNLATANSNPTRYNGSELPVEGQAALNEGDRVEMGEVAFVYHAS